MNGHGPRQQAQRRVRNRSVGRRGTYQGNSLCPAVFACYLDFAKVPHPIVQLATGLRGAVQIRQEPSDDAYNRIRSSTNCFDVVTEFPFGVQHHA